MRSRSDRSYIHIVIWTFLVYRGKKIANRERIIGRRSAPLMVRVCLLKQLPVAVNRVHGELDAIAWDTNNRNGPHRARIYFVKDVQRTLSFETQ